MKHKVCLLLCITLLVLSVEARDITFCGERVPIDNEFVAKKLINVIRQQIPQVNLPGLRRDAQRYFPMIEYILKQCNMPDDLKYIPIVESGFRNARSSAGAQGFWQLMPGTAADWGLQVTASVDERNDIYKATIAAIRELARTFKHIRGNYQLSSWVLTAAAYNWGIGNLGNRLKSGANNYFTMQLNPETAAYVYKIVAVKELFEYPELYIKNLPYNAFNRNAMRKYDTDPAAAANANTGFKIMKLEGTDEGKVAPDDAAIKSVAKPTDNDIKKHQLESFKREARLVSAKIVGKYKVFKDGDPIVIELQDDLQTFLGFQRKGTQITGKGWIIEDRVFIDLGFHSSNVILYDSNSEQGMPLSNLKGKEQVILRVQN